MTLDFTANNCRKLADDLEKRWEEFLKPGSSAMYIGSYHSQRDCKIILTALRSMQSELEDALKGAREALG